MIEFTKNRAEAKDTQFQANISVIGIGGAGSSVLNRISLDDLVEAELICMNCDARVLRASAVSKKLQLGKHITQGLGAGGDPEVGFEAANASENEIAALMEDRDMVFLCAGLGGGTGSGSSPLIAEIARSSGAFVVAFVTMPFSFEGRRRVRQAREALERLKKHTHALIVFENNRMTQLVSPGDDIQKAFTGAELLLGQSIRAVSTLVRQPGMIRIGMDDLRTALKADEARCLFGFGEASGKNRASIALERALKSPLITPNNLLRNSASVLVHIAGGASLTLHEVESLMTEINDYIPDDTQILFGAGVDEKLGDRLTVTLISSINADALDDSDADFAAIDVKKQQPTPSPGASLLHQVTGRTPVAQNIKPEIKPPAHPLIEPKLPETPNHLPRETVPPHLTPPTPTKRQKPATPDNPNHTLNLDLLDLQKPQLEPSEDEIFALPIFSTEPAPTPKAQVESPAEIFEPEPKQPIQTEPQTKIDEMADWDDEMEPLEVETTQANDPAPTMEPHKTGHPTVEIETGPDIDVEPEPDWSSLNDDSALDRARETTPAPRNSPPPSDTFLKETPRPDRFAKGEATLVDGEDLDVPTFLRLKGRPMSDR